VTFSFTKEQWERFNDRYQLITDYVAIDGRFGTEINGIISRNGIAAFRIAMILTAIRKFQERCQDDNHLCNDMDFKVALQITETLLTHSIITLKYLPKAQKLYQNTSQMHFYNILPKTFSREEAITIGKGMNLSPRSCDGYLKKFLTEKKTEKVSFGNYAKC
jgi:hypothetical protein